jgi:hypothetical protein
VRNPPGSRGDGAGDNRVGGAARFGGLVASGLVPLVVACAAALPRESPYEVHTAPAPSGAERTCAWFGDAAAGTLYFGQSAFWPASLAAGREGDPLADLEQPGPVLVGRFDLRDERLLEPLEVGGPEARAGPWDVLVHPNGRVFFTSYFETSGWVDPETGEAHLLPRLGRGLNELTLGPDGRVFASRYALPQQPGSLVVLDESGVLLAEYPLPAPPGYVAGPKSVAVHPLRGQIWLSMDLLPDPAASDDLPIRHDAYVLDAAGSLLRRIERPHLHFPAFGLDGTGYHAEVEDGALWLRRLDPDADPLDDEAGVRILLDATFPERLDFAQEVRPLPGGGAVVTRWSGFVHRVDAADEVHTLRLPPLEPRGLYYTAVLHDGRVCATHCAEVSVVCSDMP